MNDPSVLASFRSEILRLLVPLAALAAMASFAVRETDPSGAAESTYLAVLAAAMLLAVGCLARWPVIELGLGATLATAALWSLPPGPSRGAAMVLVLVATLAVAAGRRLVDLPSKPIFLFQLLIPLALALQFLLRGELLFEPILSFRTLVALLALPVAGAAAVAMLARRHGALLALTAGATAIVLAPGFNVASTLSLIALAAGDLLGWEALDWRAKAAAWIVLLAPILWEPGSGLAAAVCALALWRPRIALALAVPVAALLGWYFQMPWEAMARQLAWLPLVLPAVILPQRQRLAEVLIAAVIAATMPLVPDLSTLAAPLGLAALHLRRDEAVLLPQRVWTCALLAGTALLASYPWLRAEPLASALSLLGLQPGGALAVCVALVLLALAGLGAWLGRGWGEPLRSARLAGLAAACLLLALLLGLPARGTDLLAPEAPIVLDARNPSWQTGIPETPVRAVVLESNLANGAGLAHGAPVATVQLRDARGRTVHWTLRAGEDVGEWAARRPDVARLGNRSPRAWISWVAGDFFAQRYRCRWGLPRPERFVQVRIERAPGAPPDLALALYQLEIRR